MTSEYVVNYTPTAIISSGNGYSITPDIYDLQYMSLWGYYYFTLPEGIRPMTKGVEIGDITLTDRYAVYKFISNDIEPITKTMSPQEVVKFYEGKIEKIYENQWENAMTYPTYQSDDRLYNFPVTNVVSFVGNNVTDGVISRPTDPVNIQIPRKYLFTVDIAKIVDNTSGNVLQPADVLCDLFLAYKDGITEYSFTDYLSLHNNTIIENAKTTWNSIRPYASMLKYVPIVRTVASLLL